MTMITRFFLFFSLFLSSVYAIESEKVTLEPKSAHEIVGSIKADDLFEVLKERLKAHEGQTGERGVMIAQFSLLDEKEMVLKTFYPSSKGEAKTPSGERLQFIHKGAYDLIDQTYEEIADELDAKGLVAEDIVEEHYVKDLRSTAENELVVLITISLKKNP